MTALQWIVKEAKSIKKQCGTNCQSKKRGEAQGGKRKKTYPVRIFLKASYPGHTGGSKPPHPKISTSRFGGSDPLSNIPSFFVPPVQMRV